MGENEYTTRTWAKIPYLNIKDNTQNYQTEAYELNTYTARLWYNL